jgi:hypothetical protein
MSTKAESKDLSASLFGLYSFSKIGFRLNVSAVNAAFTIVLHSGKNSLNCSAASSVLIPFELGCKAVQESGVHRSALWPGC